nr:MULTISPECIES: hypothetical protein [unclassified Nocardioides]
MARSATAGSTPYGAPTPRATSQPWVSASIVRSSATAGAVRRGQVRERHGAHLGVDGRQVVGDAPQ